MDAFGAKPFLLLRYTGHKFCIILHAKGHLNAPKNYQTSFWVQCSRMDAFGVKPVPQLRYTKIVHLGPNHKFCLFLHAEGFVNAQKTIKHHFG
jgi:hypothetical protein